MKKFVSFLISLMLVLSLVACGTAPEIPDTTTPDTTIESIEPSTEEILDLTADAKALLVEKLGNDEEAIEILLTNVPDIFMLDDITFACWTYFLHMSDGIEYIVITDYEFNITSISYWDSDTGNSGPIIYEVTE